MAENTRKVLINRHSSKAYAPSASTMYDGEIAVSHPTGNQDATTIYTKNGNVMVPFASCAMTMTMINNAISAADVTYEVKAADKDAHIEVVSSGTEKAKVFIVSSKNVMSEDAFNTYSAATDATIKDNYNTLSGAIDDVLHIVTTAITGDDIIKVDPTTSGAGTYKLTHKKALAADGFKKLATDAYGHVTAATAVEASDIKNLGFGDSAWTEGKIAEEINKLDVTDTVESGKYVSKVSETDGKISVERANVSDAVLNGYTKGTDATAVATSDSINVAISKLENQVDKAKAAATTKVAKHTSATHLTLESSTGADGSVTYTIGEDNIASKSALDTLSGVVETFSGATERKIASAFTYVDEKINGLDVETVSGVGQAITAISQTDGKIAAVAGDIAAAHVTVADAGDKLTAKTVEDALAELADKAKAITITNTDKSINVVTSTNGTDINVNIKSGEHVLAKGGDAGLYTNIKLSARTPSSTTVKEEYALYATDGTELGDHIKIYKDSHIKSIEYITNPVDAHYQNLKYTYIDTEEKEQTVYVDMSSLVLEAEFASGITVTDHVAHGVVDPNTETFLTVGADGFKLSGVQAAIDAAKAAATTKVVEGTDEGNNMEIVSNTGTDGSVTYTVNLTDVASKAALDAEIAARKAVEGQNGDTYAANADTNYISSASSLNDADIKLDTAIKAVSDAVTAETKAREDAIAALDSSAQTSGNGYFLTSVTITDGMITAVGESDKVNSASTADKVANAFSISGYASSESTSLDSAVSYNGSGAQSITFGKDTAAGKSMSFNAGVIDVEIIDCGEY